MQYMNTLVTFAMIGIIYIVNGTVKYYKMDESRKKVGCARLCNDQW